MKILVLGGAGYIGSHTVYELIDAGEEVVIIDNLETGHIEAVHPQAKFYKGDLRNKDRNPSVTASPCHLPLTREAALSVTADAVPAPPQGEPRRSNSLGKKQKAFPWGKVARRKP